jgi:hypothetical protein
LFPFEQEKMWILRFAQNDKAQRTFHAARTGHIIDYKGPAFVSLKRRAAKEEAA